MLLEMIIEAFEAFTPKFALNYKLTPSIAVYSSFGFSFDSPAGNELDDYPRPDRPANLLNPDLEAQNSTNFELGIKGNLLNEGSDFFINNLFEFTFFNTVVESEIVPFEVYGDVYFRNSARTNRRGLEAGITSELYEGLKATLSYTFSDFAYDEYSAISIDLDSTGQITESSQDYSGNVVPSVPKHNFVLALQYQHRLHSNINAIYKRFISKYKWYVC